MLKKLIYTGLLYLTFSAIAVGQGSQVLYYMNLPQNHLLNPALKPSNSVYVGLPVLTGINVNVDNNFINFSDIFIPGKNDSVFSFLHPDYNVDDFIKKLKKKNFLAPNITIQLFGLGFNAGKDLYIFLDVLDRISGNVVLPGKLVELALKGNEDYIGQTIDLSDLDGEFKYFREFGLGFSKNIGKDLRIGFKAKALFGMMAFSLENNALALTVNEDYTHTLTADLTAHLSGPMEVYYNSDNQPDSIAFDDNYLNSARFFTNFSNPGFGMDLGATYTLMNRIHLSAGVRDLGFITWKDNVKNIKAESHFEFSGFNITDVVNGTKTMDEIGKDMLDSLKNSFSITNDKSPFTTPLPAVLTLGGSFDLTKSISVGILSNSTLVGNQIRQAATISANLNLGNAFSTTLCYTAANSKYNNLGAGIAFRLGVVQFYFIADKIPVSWNKIISDGNTVVIPDTWNKVHMMAGLNFVFGNRILANKDKPILMDENADILK
jgi:hypothetical protein